MTTYRSYSNGKLYEFKQGKNIGKGAFGEVGEVQDRPEFIYKEIQLTQKPNDWVRSNRDMCIKSVYRELYALKKLNLLEGYIHDKERIILIMQKVKGMVERKSIPNPNFNPQDPNSFPSIVQYKGLADFNEDRAVATFKALLELNYKGIYHTDPQPENSLIETKDGKLKANMIDFGFAMESSYYNENIPVPL